MAMEADILRALRSHLIAFAEPLGLPIAFTNKPFQAPTKDVSSNGAVVKTVAPYLRETFLPNGTVRAHISDAASSSWRGLYQIDVFWPLSKGQTEAMQRAGEIAAHFAPAGRLNHGAASVRITQHPEVSAAMVEDTRLMIPVTVAWTVAG